MKFPVALGVRDEIHEPLSDTLPPSLAALLRSRIRQAESRPVVRLLSSRDVHHLLADDGTLLAEVSVDTVLAERLAGRGAAPAPPGPRSRSSWPTTATRPSWTPSRSGSARPGSALRDPPRSSPGRWRRRPPTGGRGAGGGRAAHRGRPRPRLCTQADRHDRPPRPRRPPRPPLTPCTRCASPPVGCAAPSRPTAGSRPRGHRPARRGAQAARRRTGPRPRPGSPGRAHRLPRRGPARDPDLGPVRGRLRAWSAARRTGSRRRIIDVLDGQRYLDLLRRSTRWSPTRPCAPPPARHRARPCPGPSSRTTRSSRAGWTTP